MEIEESRVILDRGSVAYTLAYELKAVWRYRGSKDLLAVHQHCLEGMLALLDMAPKHETAVLKAVWNAPTEENVTAAYEAIQRPLGLRS